MYVAPQLEHRSQNRRAVHPCPGITFVAGEYEFLFGKCAAQFEVPWSGVEVAHVDHDLNSGTLRGDSIYTCTLR